MQMRTFIARQNISLLRSKRQRKSWLTSSLTYPAPTHTLPPPTFTAYVLLFHRFDKEEMMIQTLHNLERPFGPFQVSV